MNKKIQIMIFRRFQIAAIGLSCLCCNIHGQTFGDAFEDKTLRLDYTFCGNNRHQRISLCEMTVTDGWFGRRNNLDKLLLNGNG